MPIITLPYGSGLQRSDGIMVRQPVNFEDLRNVFLYEGKAEIRKGMTERSVLQNQDPIDIDQVVGLESLRSQQAAMAVGYQTATEELWLNILAIDGSNASAVGLLEDVSILNNGWQYAVPSFIMSESDSMMLIAHDEPNISGRVTTKIYDPFGVTISDLQADLDGINGLQDVKFRGVLRHLSYMIGWGYGNFSDDNRPDVLRISDAGAPTVFQDFAFFEVGQRAERITCSRTAGTSLIVFKETETYELFGYSPDTFGIRPVDTLFGCVGHRLAVSVGDQVFFWSNQGPRVISGGTKSTDLAVPLDIEGPDPATLVAESEVHDAFAQYSAKDRTVLFVWGRRVYALSIRNPNQPRWSYYELGETAQVGAQLFTTETGSGGTVPTGYPDITLGSMVPKVGDESTALTLTWDNIGDVNAALIQIYLSDDAGATYILKKAVAATSSPQTTDIEGLVPNTSYKVSLRAFRGGSGTTPAVPAGVVDWTGDAADADTWDSAVFRGQATASTAEAVPLLTTRVGDNNGIWQRLGSSASQIIINWTIPAGAEGLDIEIERSRGDEGDLGTQVIQGGVGPPDSGGKQNFAPFSAVTTVAAGTTQYVDAEVANDGQWNRYRLRFVGAVTYSPTMDCWGGPDAPGADWLGAFDGESTFISAEWINAVGPLGRTACPGPTAVPANHYTNGFTNNMDIDPSSDNWLAGLPGDRAIPYSTVGGYTSLGGTPPLGMNDTVRLGIRHEVTCFGTIYPSYWARVTASPDFREGEIGGIE